MDKTVLVTGSSRGIGKETAIYLAKNGFDIVLHCNKNKDKALEVKKSIEEIGRNVRILQFDVSNREQTKEVLIKDIENNGIYYGVVVNAGITADNSFPAMEDDEWDRVINTNLNGFYNTLRPLILPMVQNRKGRIVALSSVSGLAGNRGQINYSASKAGIIGAVKTLSREVAKRNITVNCVAPGVIESDMTSDIPFDMIKETIPMRRMGTAKEVASAINYLFSEDASYITGQVISVNGGMY
ncbi:MAG: 3-oxoacyl-ACP reductase FabG [Candidatus Gastranaerophilaceae bacterium]|nr:3-oxoacyl-ACP reductase FabG [Candidatus Gastranaerophilaceae bacterium]